MRTSNISVSFPKAVRAILQSDNAPLNEQSSKHVIKRNAYQKTQIPGPGAYNIDKNWMEKDCTRIGKDPGGIWILSRQNRQTIGFITDKL